MRLILASQSPRRRDFLTRAGYAFDVMPADIDETRAPNESAAALVRRLAIEKGQVVFNRLADQSSSAVLSADTTVWLSPDRVLEKPADDAHAIAMLTELSGRRHFVSTGWALVSASRTHAAVSTSVVEFRSLSETEIRAYVATGEPADKAGAYGIQGGAAAFVTRINGSWAAIAGLPIADIVPVLHAFGVTPASSY